MIEQVIEMIEAGDFSDFEMDQIREAITQRKIATGQNELGEQMQKMHGFRTGNIVEIVGRLRPNYLFGHKFEVVKVNPKTVVIDVPNEPMYRRFAGHKGVRIPKTAVKLVG